MPGIPIQRGLRGKIMEQHLTPQNLQAFASGELSREGARAVVAHLLSGCQACRSESAGAWLLEKPQEALPADAYDTAFDRVLAAFQGCGHLNDSPTLGV
jgi:anti-sigma factor ChrR (cupin superfamily)